MAYVLSKAADLYHYLNVEASGECCGVESYDRFRFFVVVLHPDLGTIGANVNAFMLHMLCC